jgi:peroxiredoxin
MEALEMNVDAFQSLNVRAFGISVDPVPSKKAWAAAINVRRTSLLSDFWPHGAVASSFGIFRKEDGFSERASIFIDAEGAVRIATVHPLNEVPDVRELLDKIRNL